MDVCELRGEIFNLFIHHSNSYNYEDDYHQRICLHVEIAVPVIGRVSNHGNNQLW